MRVMRRAEWAWPSRPEHLEVLDVEVPGSDKPPLLFLHGLAHGAWCYGQHWQPASAQRGYSSYAMSLRGHGGSGGATRLRRTALRDYVHDVLQVVTTLPSPPVLVAHSLGSLIAARVMPRYPWRGAVLLTPVPPTGVPAAVLRGVRHRTLDFTRAMLGATLRLRADDLFADLPAEQARAYVSRLGHESPWAQYAALIPERVDPPSCPLLVVGARDDALLASGDVRRCAEAFGVEPVWVPGGHDVMLDGAWPAVLDTVLDWVDERCPAGPALPGARGSDPLNL
jgi:pimeloyl-ACP methyl ester carboxylesterase